MMSKTFFLTVVIVFLIGCDEGGSDISVLYGEWHVYEYGYSPGSGYITEEVASDPPQIMKFDEDQTFMSNYEGFEEYGRYRVGYDSVSGATVLTLFALSQKEIEQRSYNVELNGNKARLSYRFCIEGCHIGLRKLD